LFGLHGDRRRQREPQQRGQSITALGAYNAINTDGGASAELEVSNGKGGATNLNNSGTKDIGADLGIYAQPLAPVPLPAAIWLFGSGLLSLLGFGRRRVAA
jgi:hypothetical protein